MSNLIEIFENELGDIETGFPLDQNGKIQIVSYVLKQGQNRIISTLGFSKDDGLRLQTNKFEWIMEFSSGLASENAAAVLAHYSSLVLERKMTSPLRGSFVLFEELRDKIWADDNSRGLYFTMPIFRSETFKAEMKSVGITPIWVIPITSSDVEILENHGWRSLENYWDENETNLFTTYRN